MNIIRHCVGLYCAKIGAVEIRESARFPFKLNNISSNFDKKVSHQYIYFTQE